MIISKLIHYWNAGDPVTGRVPFPVYQAPPLFLRKIDFLNIFLNLHLSINLAYLVKILLGIRCSIHLSYRGSVCNYTSLLYFRQWSIYYPRILTRILIDIYAPS